MNTEVLDPQPLMEIKPELRRLMENQKKKNM